MGDTFLLNIPCIEGIYFENESSLDIEEITAEIEKNIKLKLDLNVYEKFCRNKFRKPVYDIYALFAPFNEAIRAFYPFVPFLKQQLKQGDIIVDVWNRTGWSSILLASLFPEQKVISCWEGDSDVLGYNGFAYWLGSTPNIEIRFAKPNAPFSFENSSISLVLGFDTLHRQIKSNLVPEILRILKPEGYAFFPHVHLANNQPVPYFKRGGDLIHGESYLKLFSKFTGERNAYVFSEPDLFNKSLDDSFIVHDNASTTDYNGLVSISPKGVNLNEELKAFNYFDYFQLNEGYLIVNPLLEINAQRKVNLRQDSLKSEIEYLLVTHPVYVGHLNKSIEFELTEIEWQIYFWASRCKSCVFIKEKLGISDEVFKAIILRLQAIDLWQILPVKEQHVRLQHYFSWQTFITSHDAMTLSHLWKRALKSYPNQEYIFDRNEQVNYTYQEFEVIVEALAYTLQMNGCRNGNRIIVHADICLESIAIFWACMRLGLVFVPIKSDEKEGNVESILIQNQPNYIFLNKIHTLQEKWQHKAIIFDREEQVQIPFGCLLSDWVQETALGWVEPKVEPECVAAVLYTSGSSGNAKGVVLTQSQLFQSAISFVEAYHWNSVDRYLAIGTLDQMSALRNACLITAESGSVCVIPTINETQIPTACVDALYESKITKLAANPSLLAMLLTVKDVQIKLAKVQLVLSTGSALTPSLKERFFEKMGLKIHNYYGLTETSGFCIGECIDSANVNSNSIGKAFHSLIKIVNEENTSVSVDEKGELFVYNGNISTSYLGNSPAINIDKEGWFNTGDIAIMKIDGSIELVGRKLDFIKNARSEIVYFKEIEELVRKEDEVKDLIIIPFFENEAEKIALLVAFENQENESILDRIRESLQNYLGTRKTPVIIKSVNTIPRKINGKISKEEILKLI